MDGDNDVDGADKEVNPFDASGNLVSSVTEYRGSADLVIITPSSTPPNEYTRACGSSDGSCTTVIETELFINVDRNCDRDLSDESYPATGLCLVWQVQTPNKLAPGFVAWGSGANIQSRLEGSGGDKTVQIKPVEPNAITLVGLRAASNVGLPAILGAVALGALAAGSLAVVYRKRKV